MTTLQSEEQRLSDIHQAQKYATPPTPPKAKLIVIGLAVLITSLTAWSLISAVQENRNKGVVSVQVSDEAAEISIIQAYQPTINTGKGATTARLNPGDYTVIATSGDKRALASVSVERGTTTTVDLQLQDQTKSAAIAPYTASSLFTINSSLFFLNTDTYIPNTITIGKDASQKIAPNTYPVQRIEWISDSSFFILKNDVWRYVNNGVETSLKFGDMTTDGPTTPDSIDFTKSGSYAFVDSAGNIKFASQPTATATKIGTASDSNYHITVLGDNSVVAYPTINNPASNKKTIRIKDGKISELSVPSTDISYMAWSTDSSKAVYATPTGLAGYDAASNKTTPVLAASNFSPYSVSWSNDNQLVFIYDKSVWRYSPMSNTADALATQEGTYDAGMPWVADGLVYFSMLNDGDDTAGGMIYRAALSTKNNSQVDPPTKPLATAYIGFEKLLKYGTSSDQLTNTKLAMSNFADTLNPRPSEISVGTITSIPKAEEDERSAVSFSVTINDKTYTATLERWSVAGTRIYLTLDKRTVFDSGDMN